MLAVLQALQDSQQRVRSMALIHEKLYQSESLAQIDYAELHIRDLSASLCHSYDAGAEGHSVDVGPGAGALRASIPPCRAA